MINKISIVFLIFILLISCHKANNVIESKGLSVDKKIEIIKTFIDVKSKINDVDFKLFDVNYNNTRTIP